MRKAIIFGLTLCAAIGLAVGVGSRAAQAQTKLKENAAIELDHGWEFRQVAQGSQENESGWLPAKVPGDVHLDLLANKKIPDPFFRDNEAKLQWIENESWEYRLNFAVTADILARSNVDLVFDGLDTASQVYVNGDQVLNADNMFRVWEFAARGLSLAHQGRGSSSLKRSVSPQVIDPGQNLHPQGSL